MYSFCIIIYFSLYNYISLNIYSITKIKNISIASETYLFYKNDFFDNEKNNFQEINQFIKYVYDESFTNEPKSYVPYTQNNEIGTVSEIIKDIFYNGDKKYLKNEFILEEGNYCQKSILLYDSFKNLMINVKSEERNLNDKNDIFFKCKKLIGNTNFVENNKIITTNPYSKVLIHNYSIFGLNSQDDFLYKIIDYNINSDNKDILLSNNEKKECFSKKLKNFFISKNNLILITKEGEICSIIFDDSSSNNKFNDSQEINYISENLYKTNNSNIEILDIKMKGNYLLYYSEKGKKCIYKLHLFNKVIINTYTYDNIKGDILSFILLNNTIYAIEENFGLLIFNLTSEHLLYNISISNAYQIDLIKNGFNGFLFAGIYLNKTDYDEFFIELAIYDEIKPTINKILVYKPDNEKHYNFGNHITFDNFFTYFYDNIQNQIIGIRRGLINKINFLTYFFKLKNLELNSPLLIPNINKLNNKIFFSLLKDEKLIKINEFSYNNNSLNCNFFKKGFYSIFFSHYSDHCAVKNSNNIYSYCLITEIYDFRVFDNFNIKPFILIGSILGCVIFIFIVSIILFEICRFSKHKDLGIKLKTNIDKNNRKELYFSNNGYNFKRNKKCTSKQFNKKKLDESIETNIQKNNIIIHNTKNFTQINPKKIKNNSSKQLESIEKNKIDLNSQYSDANLNTFKENKNKINHNNMLFLNLNLKSKK